MKQYKVKFSIEKTVEAESESEAEEFALDRVLQWNWYYVHDYINLESVEVIQEIVWQCIECNESVTEEQSKESGCNNCHSDCRRQY